MFCESRAELGSGKEFFWQSSVWVCLGWASEKAAQKASETVDGTLFVCRFMFGSIVCRLKLENSVTTSPISLHTCSGAVNKLSTSCLDSLQRGDM